ncbi:unnamed protein product [Penicillium discolor]
MVSIPIDAITSRFGDRFNNLRSTSLSTRFANLRPISEFLDVKRLSKPANFGEAQSRVNYNLSYFSSNYAVVFVMLSIYSLLTNLVLLFDMIFVSCGLYGINMLQGRDLDLGFSRFTTSQLYTGLLIVGVPIGIWASPLTTALWLIGATGVTVFGHAAPPGARTGRNTRGRAAWEETRLEEVDSEEDVYGRELVRSGRYRQEYGGRGPRRRPVDYEDLTDESESVEGGEYDLYDHEDSTVAYAMQLAMRDKEDQLVDTALERIRRAQVLGKKNVRLSKRELEALERKRQQTDGTNRSRRPSAASVKGTSRPSSRRSAVVAPEQLSGAYPTFTPDAHSTWARGTANSRPSSSSSARPRTPTTQSLRPQQSNSPLRPPYPPYTPERFAPNSRPQSMQQAPVFPRPLPDDPQWAPPYYNTMQMSPYGEPAPYQPQVPTDLRAGQQNRMSYPSSLPYPAYQSQSPGKRSPQGTASTPGDLAPAPTLAPSKLGSEESSEESESSEDEVQIVKVAKVAERKAPAAVAQRRPVTGTTRKRTSR